MLDVSDSQPFDDSPADGDDEAEWLNLARLEAENEIRQEYYHCCGRY